jgi:hypothetical protein
MPFTAWLAVSEVGVAGWVLAVVQVDVLGAVAVAVGTVVDDDVAVAVSGSGCERRGWGLGWGAVGRLGSVCRRFRDAGGSSEAGEKVVVVVFDDAGVVDGNVDVADGGCAGVVNGNVADSGGNDGLVGVVWVLASTRTAVSRIVGSVCSRLVSHISRSAVLPRSSPSFSPFSNCIVPAAFNALVNPSFANRNPSSRPSFIIAS